MPSRQPVALGELRPSTSGTDLSIIAIMTWSLVKFPLWTFRNIWEEITPINKVFSGYISGMIL